MRKLESGDMIALHDFLDLPDRLQERMRLLLLASIRNSLAAFSTDEISEIAAAMGGAQEWDRFSKEALAVIIGISFGMVEKETAPPELFYSAREALNCGDSIGVLALAGMINNWSSVRPGAVALARFLEAPQDVRIRIKHDLAFARLSNADPLQSLAKSAEEFLTVDTVELN